MSRYTFKYANTKKLPYSYIVTDLAIIELGVHSVAWGFDHAVGFFFQALNSEGDALIDLDSMFQSLTGEELLDKLIEFDVPVDSYQRQAMLMELPF